MGLDMYLNKKTYVQRWDHQSEEEKFEVTVKLGGEPFKEIKMERVSFVEEQVAYWRKANAIHRWFVENVQGGHDDCRDAYVSREQIKELVDTCKQALSLIETVEGDCEAGITYHPNGKVERHRQRGRTVTNVKMLQETLPTQSGFFFGNTAYDEWYIRQLEDTVEMLESVLQESNTGDFYYSSSW